MAKVGNLNLQLDPFITQWGSEQLVTLNMTHRFPRVQLGCFELELKPTWNGPVFVARKGSETEPLATLLNHAIEIQTAGIEEGVKAKGLAGNAIIGVEPAPSQDRDRELRAEWKARSGEDLPPFSVADIGMMGVEDPLAVPWDLILEGIELLKARRANWRPEPGPALFTRPARPPERFYITPQDWEVVKKLEEEAKAIDALAGETERREDLALNARRQAFLRAACEAGVFDADWPEARLGWLSFWGASQLWRLRTACLQLREWGFLGENEDPICGPVCLDYVRLRQWPDPEGLDDDDLLIPLSDNGAHWARFGIRMISIDSRGRPQGVIWRHSGNERQCIVYRYDGDRPALLAVKEGWPPETFPK